MGFYEFFSQTIIAGVLAGISDFVAQKLSGIQNLQLKRLLFEVITSLLLFSVQIEVVEFAYFLSCF